MKKFFIMISFLLLALPAFSETLEGGIDFDWISKTQLQRDENIQTIQNILFADSVVLKYPKNELKSKYANLLKDKEYKEHYIAISNGKTEDEDKNYSGFFMKNGWLYMYAFQYKKDLKTIYYYDTMGNLRYIDYLSDNYPNFPYYSSQYSIKGELISKIYFVSNFDQYMFNPNASFKGRWYKEKMYNNKAKVIMYRSNY